MKKLQELLAALNADDCTSFVEEVDAHVSRQEGKDLEELFQAASRRDMVAVCDGLKKQVNLAIAMFTGTASLDAGAADAMDSQESAEALRQAGCECLMASGIVARLLFAELKPSPPDGLFAVATLLHDHAQLEAAEFPALQDEVSKLCIEWWQAEAPGRERLTPQTVPCLIIAALRNGTASAVKRCHALRGALALFDFDDSSIGDVKRLLLRAAFAPSFLRCAEGRRFVAALFNLQPGFVRELTAIVKNQIPAGRRSVLDAYGDIIYRAWSTATGACLLEIKESCIQNLMEAAIFASTPALSTALRRVLRGLHGQKHQPGVDAMLLELYEPILFRRLNAANPAVRCNALQLLVDAFPLRDAEEPTVETDARMNEQFAALSVGLKDDVPSVRIAAIAGVCHILGTYWELLPAAVAAGYIKCIAGDLAFDTSSPSVRVAVAEGLSTLVDEALAQPLLAVVLPKLAPMLHDNSLRVRVAFANLLLALRGVQAVRWYDIVNVKELLEVMATDAAPVSERIQRLLLPSYFPDLQSGPALIAALLRSSPDAGRAFCLYLAGVSLPAAGGIGAATLAPAGPAIAEHCLAALAKDLSSHLLDVPLMSEAAAARKRGEGRTRSKRKKPRGGDGPQPVPEGEEPAEVVETPQSWENILGGLEAVCIGLGTLMDSKIVDAGAARGLFAGNVLPSLWDRCPSSTARARLAHIVTALPSASGAPDIRVMCANLLMEDAEMPDMTLQAAAVDAIMAHVAAREALLRGIYSSFGASFDSFKPRVDHAKSNASEEAPAVAPIRVKRLPFDLTDMSESVGVTCLALILELEASRNYVISSGILAHLTPCLQVSCHRCLAKLAESIATHTPPARLEGKAGADSFLVMYMRVCLHLLLHPSNCESSDEGRDGDQALRGLALTTQRMVTLLETATKMDGSMLAKALMTLKEPTKSSKRLKAAKTCNNAATNLSAIKEAFMACTACAAILAEAACVKGFSWLDTSSDSSIETVNAVQSCVQFACEYLSFATTMAPEALGAGIDDLMSNAVSHTARLLRYIVEAAATPAAFNTETAQGRDLTAELAQVAMQANNVVDDAREQPDDKLCRSVSEAVAKLWTSLLLTDAFLSAAKPVLGPLFLAWSSGPGFAGSSHLWLEPIAELLAKEIDFSAVAEDVAPMNDHQHEHETNENEDVTTSTQKTPHLSCGKVLSDAASHALVKHVLAAAKHAKCEAALASRCIAAASTFLRSGQTAHAIGAVELAQLLGYRAIATTRGNCRTAGNADGESVRCLQSMDLHLSENADGLQAKVLRSKLQALVPTATEARHGSFPLVLIEKGNPMPNLVVSQ